MDFTEYNGPASIELEEAWPSLTEDQQAAIQAEADEAFVEFLMANLMGNAEAAMDVAFDTLRKAHSIAGLPQPGLG